MTILSTNISLQEINYANRICIITSWNFSNSNIEDMKLREIHGRTASMLASIKTRQSFCRHAAQLFKDHYCGNCADNAKSGPSTEDEVSSEDKNGVARDTPIMQWTPPREEKAKRRKSRGIYKSSLYCLLYDLLKFALTLIIHLHYCWPPVRPLESINRWHLHL